MPMPNNTTVTPDDRAEFRADFEAATGISLDAVDDVSVTFGRGFIGTMFIIDWDDPAYPMMHRVWMNPARREFFKQVGNDGRTLDYIRK